MSKTHVYELAKKLGIENKELLARLKSLGIEVKSHLSVLEEEDVQRVTAPAAPPKGISKQEEVRVTTTVIRRRPKIVEQPPEEIEPVAAEAVESAVPAPGAKESAPIVATTAPEETETPKTPEVPSVEAPKAEKPVAEEPKIAVAQELPKPVTADEEKPTMNRARILGRVELPDSHRLPDLPKSVRWSFLPRRRWRSGL